MGTSSRKEGYAEESERLQLFFINLQSQTCQQFFFEDFRKVSRHAVKEEGKKTTWEKKHDYQTIFSTEPCIYSEKNSCEPSEKKLPQIHKKSSTSQIPRSALTKSFSLICTFNRRLSSVSSPSTNTSSLFDVIWNKHKTPIILLLNTQPSCRTQTQPSTTTSEMSADRIAGRKLMDCRSAGLWLVWF